MGFDCFSVEDAPKSEQYAHDRRNTEDSPLLGHWRTLGHMETFALGTYKLYFRFKQGIAPIAADILRHAGMDMDAIRNLITDPTRTESPKLTRLNVGEWGACITITDGKQEVTKFDKDSTLGKEAAKLLREEAELQKKAGPRAHRNQCWECKKRAEQRPMRCSRCKRALYCSKECQKKAWKGPPLHFPKPAQPGICIAVATVGHKQQCSPPQRFSLADAMFRYNEGFHISEEVCLQIAESLNTVDKVEAAIRQLDSSQKDLASALLTTQTPEMRGQRPPPTEEGRMKLRQTMLAFGEYCKSASQLGGFYVW